MKGRMAWDASAEAVERVRKDGGVELRAQAVEVDLHVVSPSGSVRVSSKYRSKAS